MSICDCEPKSIAMRRCISERLIGDEGFAVDASLIKAE